MVHRSSSGAPKGSPQDVIVRERFPILPEPAAPEANGYLPDNSGIENINAIIFESFSMFRGTALHIIKAAARMGRRFVMGQR